jgi:glycosyltransferase involved in cell wall biosynthesis
MNKPEISIYITSYNYGRYLEKCINSILSQTMKNYEIIIIDDGSKDNSKEIIERYRQYFSEVIYQKNLGLIKSSNIAINKAQGKYIVRLDADDYLSPNALEILSNEIRNNSDVVLVFPNYYLIDSEENVISKYVRHNFDTDVSLYDQPAHGACTMISTEFLRNIGGYDEEYTRQDGYYLWLKAVTSGKRVTNVKEALFYYRQHESNLTKNELHLFQTRCSIKKKYYIERKHTICIIPYRTVSQTDVRLILEPIGNTNILSTTIDAALNTETIDSIYFSTPHIELIEYATDKYGDRINCIHRLEGNLYRSYKSSIMEVILEQSEAQYVVILEPEYPFMKSNYIDESVYTLDIFKTDYVDSVILDNNTFYYHDGNSMRPLRRNSNIRHEREDLYRRVGGISTYKSEVYGKSQNNLTASHILVDTLSSVKVQNLSQLGIARSIENDF